MTAPESTPTLFERYRRAARLTMPKVAARTPRAAVEGYWVDVDDYFFLAEYFDTEMDRMVAVPSIAHSQPGTIETIIDLKALAAVLNEESDRQLTPEDLAGAAFDMPDRQTLTASVSGWEYRIDPKRRRLLAAPPSWEVPALYSPDQR